MKKFFNTLVIAFATISTTALADFTATEIAAIKADVLADPTLAVHVVNGDMLALSDAMSAPVSDKCWDEDFTLAEFLDSLNFTTYIGRSVAEKSAIELMFSTGAVDTRRLNIRQAFADVFSGTAAAAVSQRTAITNASQRACLRVEKVLASGLVSGALVTTHIGPITWQDMILVMQ